MKQKLSFWVALAQFFVFSLSGQDTLSALRIGQWQQHLPWQRVRYVTASPDKIYCATEWAIAEIDKEDFSPRFLTKGDGLSDIGMGVVRYNKAEDVLVATYSNSNIDLIRTSSGELTNMPFIKKNVQISGDKKIYDIYFEGKFAWFSCGFGLIKMDLEREEVVFTVFTGTVVRSCAIFDNFIYAGTSEGLYRIPASNPNPADFGQWELLDGAEGFPGDYAVGPMAVFENTLYFGSEKTLYKYDGSALQTLETHPNFNVVFLTTEGEGMTVGWRAQFDGRVEYLAPGGHLSEIHWTCEATRPIYAIEDGVRKFWFADFEDDFRFFDLDKGTCDRFKYNSPKNVGCTEIDIRNGVVYAATPGPPSQLNPIYLRDGIYVFEDGQWSQISATTYPELQNGDCHVDIWRVVAHPKEDKLYAGSWVGGLIEKSGNQIKCYTKNNSILQGAGASGPDRTAIGGLAFDADNNLWISNYDAQSPIAVLKNDGTFANFSGAAANNLLNVVIDQIGYKWFVVAFQGGLLVYDSGDDLDSPADDRYRQLNNSNTVLPTNSVNCVSVDLDGDVWVGTQQGAVSFECGSNVFDDDCKGSRRILTVDDFNGYLLQNEDVTTIAVDGANRKWFGTRNGIFVFSASVDELVARYTDANSPLFDNNIADIAINPKNGEVWVATEKGIQVLRGEATAGTKVNLPEPYAYPNPVRPDYDGPIAIYGLATDANVKITDVAGNLVYEGKSLGGQAVWNGRDYTGKRAASGVYLVFATSSASFDSPDAIITKVVIIN